jgi:hypothetical protein
VRRRRREVPFGNDFPEYSCSVIPDLPGRENLGRQDASRNGLGLESPATCGGIRLRHLLRRGYEGQEGYGGQAAAFTDCPGTEAATLGKTGLCGLEGADTIDFLAVLAVGEFEIVV